MMFGLQMYLFFIELSIFSEKKVKGYITVCFDDVSLSVMKIGFESGFGYRIMVWFDCPA